MSKEGEDADFEIIVEDEVGDEEENNHQITVEERNEEKPPAVETVTESCDVTVPDIVESNLITPSNVPQLSNNMNVGGETPAIMNDQAEDVGSCQEKEIIDCIKKVSPPPDVVNEHKEADIEKVVEIPKSEDQKEVVQPVSEEDSAEDEVEEYTVEDSIEEEEKEDQMTTVENSVVDLCQETNETDVDRKTNGDLIENMQDEVISDGSSISSGIMEHEDPENIPIEESFNESVSSMSDSIEIVDEMSKNEEIAQRESSDTKEVALEESTLVQKNENNDDNDQNTIENSTNTSAMEISAANDPVTNENYANQRPAEPLNIRKDPLPEVMLFVDSLTQLSFDWKKYSCFFCKNLVRWKMINDLNAEPMTFDRKLQDEIVSHKDFIVGLDKIIAIKPNGKITCFVCMLCNFVCADMGFLITHLGAFDHIDNFMEYVRSHLYKPTTCCSLPLNDTENMRLADDKVKNWIINEAKSYIRKNGQCKIRLYSGQKYRNWITVDAERREMEDDFQRDQIGKFLTDWQSIEVKSDVISAGWSAANCEYEKLNVDDKHKYIGLQYLVELWSPTRRAIAVWYCALCDSLVIDWTTHCSTMQHVAVYLKKEYKEYVFDCAVLEAENEEQMRQIFEIAKAKVLQFEGCQARVKYVLQIHELCNIDTFVAINAKIAKVLVERHKLEFGSPPRKSAISDDALKIKSFKFARIAFERRLRRKERRRVIKDQRKALNQSNKSVSEASDAKNTKLVVSSKAVSTDKDSKSTPKQNGSAKRSPPSSTKSSDVSTSAKKLKTGTVVPPSGSKGKENRNDDKASQRRSTGSRDSPKSSPSARRRRRSPSHSRRSRSRSRDRRRSADSRRRSSAQSQSTPSAKVIPKKVTDTTPIQQSTPKPKPSPGQAYPEEATLGPFVLLTPDDLAKFTDLLKAVGIDLGRQLLIEDLQLIRSQFPEPDAFDALLGNLLKRNKEEIESVAKMDSGSS